MDVETDSQAKETLRITLDDTMGKKLTAFNSESFAIFQIIKRSES